MENYEKYKELIINYAKSNFKKMLREPNGLLKYKYIVPGSVYSDSLWDWDSWLTNLALRKIASREELSEYEKGCVLNFIENIDDNNRMPILIVPTCAVPVCKPGEQKNVHKPCLAQHALFISREDNSFEWLNSIFCGFERYIDFYFKNCRHESGLFYWVNDTAIGVDNDPCTFYRPYNSSASIYLNCLMYKELEAISIIAGSIGFSDKEKYYQNEAENLKAAIREHMWDERNGFYYSVDINLLPINKDDELHSGCPRHWNTIIQKIDVWSGFMAMWAGIATCEQAERMVKENYKNEKTFNAPYGVRTLSKLEKMYKIIKSGNPSCWLGPIWGISNYMVFEGLRNYGFTHEAVELAEKTIKLFGQDLEKNGELHEYYHPETGEGVNNPGFQNWNLLVLSMLEMIDEL